MKSSFKKKKKLEIFKGVGGWVGGREGRGLMKNQRKKYIS